VQALASTVSGLYNLHQQALRGSCSKSMAKGRARL